MSHPLLTVIIMGEKEPIKAQKRMICGGAGIPVISKRVFSLLKGAEFPWSSRPFGPRRPVKYPAVALSFYRELFRKKRKKEDPLVKTRRKCARPTSTI